MISWMSPAAAAAPARSLVKTSRIAARAVARFSSREAFDSPSPTGKGQPGIAVASSQTGKPGRPQVAHRPTSCPSMPKAWGNLTTFRHLGANFTDPRHP